MLHSFEQVEVYMLMRLLISPLAFKLDGCEIAKGRMNTLMHVNLMRKRPICLSPGQALPAL
jgi:hypothetical protein